MEMITNLLSGVPWLVDVLLWVGVLRLLNKPLFTFLETVVEAIPGDGDDKLLAAVMESKVYKAFTFLVDYLGSVKLPKRVKSLDESSK